MICCIVLVFVPLGEGMYAYQVSDLLSTQRAHFCTENSIDITYKEIQSKRIEANPICIASSITLTTIMLHNILMTMSAFSFDLCFDETHRVLYRFGIDALSMLYHTLNKIRLSHKLLRSHTHTYCRTHRFSAKGSLL